MENLQTLTRRLRALQTHVLLPASIISRLAARFEIIFPKRNLNIICQILLVYGIVITAQPASAQISTSLKRYTTADGLSHKEVFCILRDREGFVWLGTRDGLNRFDGNRFMVYKGRPGDNSSIKSNKIRTITEDQRGCLWIITYDKQIYRFDKKTEQFEALTGFQSATDISSAEAKQATVASSGDIWITTSRHGLLCAHYPANGSQRPVIYRFSTSRGKYQIPDNTIRFVTEDSDNNIWIGTPKGAVYYKRNGDGYQKVTLTPHVAGLIGNASCTAAIREKQWFYLGTEDGNVLAYNAKGGQWSNWTILGEKINAVHRNAAGALYVTTSRGLRMILPGATKATEAGSGGPYLSIYEDKKGLLWLEPEKKGIVRFNPADHTLKKFIQQTDTSAMTIHEQYSVFEDRRGLLWTSMKGGGFGYYDRSTDRISGFSDPQLPERKFPNIIRAIHYDRDGIMWVAGDDGGFSKIIFPENNFAFHLLVPNFKSKSENEVRAIYEDRYGRTWIATKAGRLYVLEHGQPVDVFTDMASAEFGNVYAITGDRQGNVWIGTKRDGLLLAKPLSADPHKYTVTRFQHNGDRSSLSNDLVYSILEDSKGRVWVSTLGGAINLVVNDHGKISFKSTRNSFKNYPGGGRVARCLSEDTKGNIWVGSNNGLIVFNPNKGSPDNYQFVNYQKQPNDSTSLSNNGVQCIYRDAHGNMWLGTSGGGVSKVVANDFPGRISFKAITTRDGLPNDLVMSITGDQRGDIWIATENGLARYRVSENRVTSFNAYNGLPATDFSESACLSSRSGTLYFGCLNGYVTFDPRKIKVNRIHANMVLTDMEVYYKALTPQADDSPLDYSINETDHLTLACNQNMVSIDYTVLDFRDEPISYQYKLEGFDQSWRNVGEERKATYTNIPPGDYIFKVCSNNIHLFDHKPQKQIRITILPPFWRTWWAYCIYFLMAIAIFVLTRRLVLAMITLRHKVDMEQQVAKTKIQFFTNLSHELRTPLSLIVGPLQEVSRSAGLSVADQENLQLIGKNATRLTRFVDQLLDFSKVQNGKMKLSVSHCNIVAIVKEVASHFEGARIEKNIDLDVTAANKEVFAWVDLEKMDIVLHNLLSNAFKFTPAGRKITLSVSEDQDNVSIAVIDEGFGVDEAKLKDIFELYYDGGNTPVDHLKSTGIGLALSRELVREHEGELSAVNNAEGGMTFMVTLKKGDAHFRKGDMHQVNDATTPQSRLQPQEVIPEYEPAEQTTIVCDEKAPLVLLVEDNPDMCSFLVRTLEREFRVMHAKNGIRALQQIAEKMPDVVISDIMMPRMNGIELLDKLKNDAETSHIPVVLLTAKTSLESQLEGLSYGADLYLTKPFNVDILHASIRTLLKNRKMQVDAIMNSRKVITLKPGEVEITSRDEKFLTSCVRAVEDGMADAYFNMDNVAAAVGLSRSTFFKKLKALTGLAPVDFVKDMRLRRAEQLLQTGAFNISQVAFQVGFSSPGYFSTCFKERYQISPTEYLKNIKEQSISSHEAGEA
ncbi:two-component regulator propeller domain-containing protein [Mucilaginibacter yixingensis]|uniref:hybrid sensor histidine kinase/response regulator transcription factor n=1 Tax=Mucilaginibacter yixingensis TaxID=1295612 RepID=UPI000D3077CC|nr:hybrid sensor histidine kinase/response regulator transcription factor [Mucilaginibacter yixingensis]